MKFSSHTSVKRYWLITQNASQSGVHNADKAKATTLEQNIIFIIQ
jgi:hypothetical protein